MQCFWERHFFFQWKSLGRFTFLLKKNKLRVELDLWNVDRGGLEVSWSLVFDDAERGEFRRGGHVCLVFGLDAGRRRGSSEHRE